MHIWAFYTYAIIHNVMKYTYAIGHLFKNIRIFVAQ